MFPRNVEMCHAHPTSESLEVEIQAEFCLLENQDLLAQKSEMKKIDLETITVEDPQPPKQETKYNSKC